MNDQASNAAKNAGLPSGDALVALLTVETLLFAAFAVAAVFLTRREYGWDLSVPVRCFSWGVALAIGIVAIGAVAAWADVYCRSGLDTVAIITGATLLVGIGAVAGMSWWVAHAISRNTGDA
jgi:hypothetical protein